MRLPKKYSLRWLLVIAVVAAILIQIGPPFYRRVKFSNQYRDLAKLKWERLPGHVEGYEFQASNGVLLSVWTTQHKVSKKSGLLETTNYSPDPKRFYVVPPGKWVDTIDDVIYEWDKHD